MLKKQSFSLSGLANKTTVTNIFLVANAFVWYYTILILLQTTVTNLPSSDPTSLVLIWGLHFSGLIISALVGASLAKKIERSQLLILWMTLGVISSLLLFALTSLDVLTISLLALFLGISLGIGMPTCMSYFTDCIPIESRGRISGITMFVSGIGIFAFTVAQTSNTLILGVVLAVWRLSSLIVFNSVKSLKKTENKRSFPSYRLIFSQRSFILYFVPWVMFSLVNYLTTPLQPTPEKGTADILMLVQIGFLGLFALLGGFFLDSVGRKRIAMAGFIMLGLGAAVVGVFAENPLSLYFNSVINGVAWGLLLVLFVLTIWGDLSYSSASEKYYALGVMPFFVSNFLDFAIGKTIAANISSSALFSFTAFFLFLAVLPLFYAPETLPEKTIKDRELKNYLDKAQKVAQKEAEKNQKQDTHQPEKENEKAIKETKESPEDEEAHKLAEKYY